MLKIIAATFAVLLAVTAAKAADPMSLQVGQKWTVKDSSSTIVIGAIEPFATGKTAISVSVFDVPCPAAASCTTTIVGHAPFDSQALAQSVDRLVADHAATAPNFDAGYANWKQAKGGIFTIPVSQLPDLLFKAIPAGKHLQND